MEDTVKTATNCALILAGGIGTRLWPRSRRFRPKQFLRIRSDKTLLQQTVSRIRHMFSPERIWIVTKPFQKKDVMDQVPELPEGNILIEPVPKGTAAAIAWAASLIDRIHPGCALAVLPSDHHIKEEARFRHLLQMGLELAASKPYLVTYGITPFRPETSYGYIEVGRLLDDEKFCPCYRAKSFHEKPDRRTAKHYLEKKGFLWNSGIFAFTSTTLLSSLAQYSEEIWRPLVPILRELGKGNTTLACRLYKHLPDISIDEVLFERAENVVVFPADFHWQDIGLWSSIYELLPKDRHLNAMEGKIIALDCNNCLLVADNKKFIASMGLNDMAVILARDVVLVCPRERLNAIQDIVKRLKTLGYEDFS